MASVNEVRFARQKNNMKGEERSANISGINRYMKLIIGVLAFISLAIFFHWIAEKINQDDSVNLSFAFTICFMGGIYIGRYVSYLWINSHIYVRNVVLLILPVLVFAMAVLTNIITNKLIITRGTYSNYGPSKIILLFIVFFIMSVAIGIFIKLIRRRIQDQIRAAEVNAAHSQSELQLLQSQLSPHFLFNTLNNLYGISMTEHEKIPPLLLKLSDLLRYSVYDIKELFVPLKDEISYLKNYIEFEKIRIGDRLELSAELEEVSGKNIKIAPMLLIVFVENAFKHSKNTSQQKIFIELDLKIWNKTILFSIRNSYKNENIETATAEKSGGLGLSNVRKRLELLYANEYDLKIEETPEIFNVMLRVNAK